MRINSPTGTGLPSAQPTTKKAGGSTFKLQSETASTSASSVAGGMRSIGGIDSLIALQGVDDRPQRRRRAVARGQSALEALDELKLGFLSGHLDQHLVSRLQSVVADLERESGEPGLDQVISEIELRVEVEIAKIGAGQNHQSPR